jgi:hypothetical protein
MVMNALNSVLDKPLTDEKFRDKGGKVEFFKAPLGRAEDD